MKALTLWQPWASFIAHGLKVYETRSWDTSYRGWLAIHAARRVPKEVIELCQHEPFAYWLKMMHCTVKELPRSAILCKVHLLNTFPTGTRPILPFDRQFGDFSLDRFAWEFGSIVTYGMPIPARGRQGLWNWTETESPLVIPPFSDDIKHTVILHEVAPIQQLALSPLDELLNKLGH